MQTNPLIKRIVLPEQIPADLHKSWVAFLLTLPVTWWDDKTPEERGAEAFRMWKESQG